MIDTDKQRLFELNDISEKLIASLPPRIRESIDQYVWYGVPTGGFVLAVLSNDLMGALDALRWVDIDSLSVLGLVCQYVYSAVPNSCHGSREAVESHLERGRKARDLQRTP